MRAGQIVAFCVALVGCLLLIRRLLPAQVVHLPIEGTWGNPPSYQVAFQPDGIFTVGPPAEDVWGQWRDVSGGATHGIVALRYDLDPLTLFGKQWGPWQRFQWSLTEEGRVLTVTDSAGKQWIKARRTRDGERQVQ